MQLVDQIVRKRIERGCDWGAPRVVLARLMKGEQIVKELWWRKGYKYWTGIGMPRGYMKAALEFATPYSCGGSVGSADTKTTEICTGRLCEKAIQNNAEKIDEFFSEAVACKIDLRKTLIICQT